MNFFFIVILVNEIIHCFNVFKYYCNFFFKVIKNINTVPAIKIDICQNFRRTVDFARQMESAGLTFLSVHGRTKDQRSEPVNYEAISLIKSSINIPVIANGDVKSLKEAERIKTLTNVDGKKIYLFIYLSE